MTMRRHLHRPQSPLRRRLMQGTLLCNRPLPRPLPLPLLLPPGPPRQQRLRLPLRHHRQRHRPLSLGPHRLHRRLEGRRR